MKRISLLLCLVLAGGCVHSLATDLATKTDKRCLRQCTMRAADCAGSACSAFALAGCNTLYRDCVQTCD